MLADSNAEASLRRTLLWILGGVILTDIAWAVAGDYRLEIPAYLGLGAIAAALLLGSLYYGRVRKEERLRAMLFGAGFLCAFSAAFSVLNYFLLTIAGPRIDANLAGIDAWLGFHWPSLIEIAAGHPVANKVLALAYVSMLPQIAALVVCLGVFGSSRTIYSFCLALAVAAGITVGFWTVLPSFGAFTIYELDPALAARAGLVVDANYVRDLMGLLNDGPGRIAPDQVKGLIAFPSFHAALAVLVAWYARELRFVNVAALVLCLLVLASTPIHGGHFAIDIIGGIAVALGAAALVGCIPAAQRPGKARGQAVTPDQPLAGPNPVRAAH